MVSIAARWLDVNFPSLSSYNETNKNKNSLSKLIQTKNHGLNEEDGSSRKALKSYLSLLLCEKEGSPCHVYIHYGFVRIPSLPKLKS